MGLINIYDTISNEHRTIHANGKIKDVLPDFHFEKALMINKGNRVDGDYVLNEDDVVYVRIVPSSSVAVGVALVVVSVVAAGVSVGLSINAKIKADEAKKQMESAQKAAKALSEASTQLPFIRGSNNQCALGRNVQFVMGSVYNTPYYQTGGFYSIDGSDGVNSYYNESFILGYGPQKVTQILLGNEMIAEDSNGISGETSFSRQSLYFEENSNKVEVRQPGQELTLANCNQKCVSTYSGAELKHENGQDAVPVIVQAGDNAMKIQVAIQFSCLREWDSDADSWKERTATVRPYWSNDGGANWNQFYFSGMSDNTISKNTNHTIRYVATKEFSAAESFGKNISIKVEKTTAKSEGSSQEDCALLWYQTFCYDANTSSSTSLKACIPLASELRRKTTRCAYRVTASSSTTEVLDSLHCMEIASARTWTGNSWTSSREPTRNPASWILEALNSPYHKPSKINDSEIDLPSLGLLYEHCELNHFYCDGIVTTGIKKRDLISKILTTVNADMIINADGKFEFVIDKEENTPVALLNTENIRSITYSKDFGRKADGVKVTFTNRESWQIDTFYSMLDGGSYDYANDTVTDFSCDYVTDYEHAYKLAQRKLRQQQLQPREIKATVGPEGDYYPLYSTVKLQVKQLLQGLNSSVIVKNIITDNQITGIELADQVIFEENKRYGIIIQATTDGGNTLVYSEVTGTGKTRTVTLSTPITVSNTAPQKGNHLSFGLLDNNGRFTAVTNTMKIMGISPNGDEGYILTLRDYNEQIYSYGGTIPSYKSNLTRGQVPNSAVTIDDLNKIRQDMNNLEARLRDAWQILEFPVVVSADLTSVTIEIDEDGYCAGEQKFSTNISVKQGNESRSFAIGSVSLPEGWSMSVNQGRITFTVGEGAKVESGQFKIPVVYQPVIAYYDYVDQNGDNYEDESNELYLAAEMSESTYIYDIWFNYFGLGYGVYLGMFTSLEDIPTLPNLNDYFTWGGANNTASALSIDGVFKQGRVYKFIGKNKSWEWEEDTNAGHGQAALSDVLGIANADLRNNNSTVWMYLDHLTSNSIYTDMIVANKAFIDQLAAKIITADLVTVGILDDAIANVELDSTTKSDNALDAALAAFVGAGNVRNHTIISGGQIITGLINTDAIKAAAGFFENVFISGTGYFTDVQISGNSLFKGNIDSGPLLLSDSSPAGQTVTYNAGQVVGPCNVGNCSGSYAGVTFNAFKISHISGNPQYVTAIYSLELYYNNNSVYYAESSGRVSGYTFPAAFTYTYNQSSGAKTFKLRGIPTTKPAEAGIVYAGSDGILRIS